MTRFESNHASMEFYFSGTKNMPVKSPCVYILASSRYGTLYVGVTSNLRKRVWEHKHDLASGFCSKYRVHLLVWYELHQDMHEAIRREKNIKNWKRDWKINLIERNNPHWIDLYKGL